MSLEMPSLMTAVERLLEFERYEQVLDCVHLSIPHRAIRFGGKDRYPTTGELMRKYPKVLKDPRVVLHRLPDFGPLTRYLGPVSWERHPDTSVVLFDIDSKDMFAPQKDLVLLFYAAYKLDDDAAWCFQGENFLVDKNNKVESAWTTFPSHVAHVAENGREYNLTWNLVHFCRGVGGLLFKPKHFADFWYNQSEYGAGDACFWDDDRWVSFQIDRQGYPLKVVHPLYQPPPKPQGSVLANQRAKQLSDRRKQQQQQPQPHRVVIGDVVGGGGGSGGAVGVRRQRVAPASVPDLHNKTYWIDAAPFLLDGDAGAAASPSSAVIATRRRLLGRRQLQEEEEEEEEKAVVGEDRTPQTMMTTTTAWMRQFALHGEQYLFDAAAATAAAPDRNYRNRTFSIATAPASNDDQPIGGNYRRRLGSLTMLTNQLHSDQTCPLAWLSHHPNAYPTARTPGVEVLPPPMELAEIEQKYRGQRPGGGGGVPGVRAGNLAANRKDRIARQQKQLQEQKQKLLQQQQQPKRVRQHPHEFDQQGGPGATHKDDAVLAKEDAGAGDAEAIKFQKQVEKMRELYRDEPDGELRVKEFVREWELKHHPVHHGEGDSDEVGKGVAGQQQNLRHPMVGKPEGNEEGGGGGGVDGVDGGTDDDNSSSNNNNIKRGDGDDSEQEQHNGNDDDGDEEGEGSGDKADKGDGEGDDDTEEEDAASQR